MAMATPLRIQPELAQSPPSTPRIHAVRRLTDNTRPTVAAAYATANQPKGNTMTRIHPNTKSKPLFDWFTRKLGGGRRATYSDGSGRPKDPRDETSTSRPDSVSLRSYSMAYANSVERDRRREANNPYPSIPVPPRVESTYDSVSLSFLSRSRTPSIRSESSRPRLLDDREADEDASIRPCPPSHPGSPSQSQTSRSVSIFSPAPRSQLSRRTASTDSLGRQSRQDSTSTKPTTMSIESGLDPAHIAQAINPIPTLASPIAGPSRLPASGPALVQAPKHTHPNPQYNPDPLSAPGANASTLTLASSTFATAPVAYLPAVRLRDLSARPHSLIASPSVTFALEANGDRPASTYEYNAPSTYALSAYGPSVRSWGRVDKDASVRALRRRGSTDSDQSRWSWKGQGRYDEEYTITSQDEGRRVATPVLA